MSKIVNFGKHTKVQLSALDHRRYGALGAIGLLEENFLKEFPNELEDDGADYIRATVLLMMIGALKRACGGSEAEEDSK